MKTYNKHQLITFRVKTPSGDLLYGTCPTPRYAVIRPNRGSWVICSYHQNLTNAKASASLRSRSYPGVEFHIVLAEVL